MIAMMIVMTFLMTFLGLFIFPSSGGVEKIKLEMVMTMEMKTTTAMIMMRVMTVEMKTLVMTTMMTVVVATKMLKWRVRVSHYRQQL